MDIGFELKENVAALEAALLHKHPTLPTLLSKIHKTLQQYPEQVTLLSESDIKAIVSGLQAHTLTTFSESALKEAKKPSASKLLKDRIAKMGADAF